MFKISRNNYESAFLDYLEGKLNQTEIAVLYDFFSQNADLKNELDNFMALELTANELSMPQKHKLHKQNTELLTSQELFDERAISLIEKDASEVEIADFQQFINKNPKKELDFERLKNTVLTADSSIRFPEKGKLKKGKLRLLTFRNIAAAASLLLLFALSQLFTQKMPQARKLAFTQVKMQMPAKAVFIAESTTQQSDNQQINKIKLKQASVKKEKKIAKRLNAPEKLNGQSTALLAFSEPVNEMVDNYFEIPVNEQVTMLAEANSNRKTEKKRSSSNPLWQIAELSVKAISQVTKKDVKLDNTYDSEGKIKTFAFESKYFSFSTKINHERRALLN